MSSGSCRVCEGFGLETAIGLPDIVKKRNDAKAGQLLMIESLHMPQACESPVQWSRVLSRSQEGKQACCYIGTMVCEGVVRDDATFLV